MTKTLKKEQIIAKALDILTNTPKGIRYSELMRKIQEELPSFAPNTIAGYVWNLDVTKPNEVYKPGRGIFRHTKFMEAEAAESISEIEEVIETRAATIKEEEFYPLFAEWLKNELEECTKAIALGGNKFKDKWGTPDVMGIRTPKQSDIIKLPTEIVSAEIKVDSSSLITAFGQACSYKLFSHKSYIVVPFDSLEGDIARLDALCRIFGIGLILFNSKSPEKPDFQIRVRADKHEPDMFYVNKNMKFVEDELFG
jgi:hypothetical protein